MAKDRPSVATHWPSWGAGLIGLGLGLWAAMSGDDFALDDAWIHLAYAQSLREGSGLSYNPGDLETGASSPLWALLLAILPWTDDPVHIVRAAGAVGHAGSALLTARIIDQLAPTSSPPRSRKLAAFAGGVLCATTPTLLAASTSGMEVGLAACLLLWTFELALRGHWAAVLCAALAVWARPEALVSASAFSMVLLVSRVRGALRPLAGVWLGFAAWCTYCLIVSGWPLPNTYYVKAPGGGLAGLAYVVDEVLPQAPWVVGLTGLIAIAAGLREAARLRIPGVVAVAMAYVLTVVSIAWTRPLHVGTGFYESRYFDLVAALPAILIALGGLSFPPRLRLLLALPFFVIVPVQVASVQAEHRELESDTATLHTQVARDVSARLGPGRTIAVEGAGAHRFFAPRTTTIVDVIGLNDREAAHSHFQRTKKLCHFVRRAPDHFVIPADWRPLFDPVFELERLTSYVDPAYTQVRPPRRMVVDLYRVLGLRPGVAERCREASSAPEP